MFCAFAANLCLSFVLLMRQFAWIVSDFREYESSSKIAPCFAFSHNRNFFPWMKKFSLTKLGERNCIQEERISKSNDSHPKKWSVLSGGRTAAVSKHNKCWDHSMWHHAASNSSDGLLVLVKVCRKVFQHLWHLGTRYSSTLFSLFSLS